jgi:hypothetical protein
LAVTQFDGAAGFQAAEHGHEAIVVGLFPEEFADALFLVVFAVEELVGCIGLLSGRLGVIDQKLRLLFDEGQEVLAFDFQAVIDEAIEVVVAAEREMAMKNDAVMAGENGYNGRSESLNEAVHGVLLQWLVW